MRRVVLSGITGHLGFEVARQLFTSRVEVHGLTRQCIGRDTQAGLVRLHRLDGSTESLVTLLQEIRPDTVIHLASLYRREHHSGDVAQLVETNVSFGARLLEAARLSDCRQFIAAGSFFQHFGTDEYRALNLYAATKQAFEDILAYYVDAFGISAVALTLYEIYGEADTRPKLMRAVANSCLAGTALSLPDREFWLDLVHVEDAAAAFLDAASLLKKDEHRNRFARYSVCSGRDVSSAELIALFERIGKRKITVQRGAFVQPSRNMQRPWRGPVLPGWTPRVTLEDGIGRMLARLL